MDEKGNIPYDNVRQLLAKLYDEEYKTLKDLYGGSSDEVGEYHDDDGEERELPAFTSNRSRVTRPYLQPTEFDDSGFRGLEPPVG